MDGPEYGGQYTRERIENLRANVERYDWASARRDDVVRAAARWAGLSDEALWELIPGQELPRNIDPQMDRGIRTGGCPACGKDVYEKGSKYPWRVSVWDHPWKVACPACGALLPGNDFGAYYRSGIDDTGCFNPGRADRSLLFNADHPDPADRLHASLADDGWGFRTADGAVNRFIGYYGFILWKTIKEGVAALAEAYLFTGEAAYAHQCGLLLDRIADVYPAMDWAVYGGQGWFHSGSTDGGKIEGSIWEVGTVLTLARAYDMVKSGLCSRSELLDFLAERGRRLALPSAKGTYENLVSNIETNLLGEFVKAVKTGRKTYGNEGDPQHCVVISALALNRAPLTGEWIDWIFGEGTVGQGALKPGQGGHVPALILGAIDRDGVGAEGAPSYSLGWGTALGAAADLLHEYEGYTRRDIYRDFPPFKRTFTAGWRLGVLASHTPNIGDSGGCGTRGLIGAAPGFIVRGYRLFGDREIGLAAVRAARGKTGGLGRDPFAADPLRVEKDLERLAAQYGADPPILGSNRAGYGLVSVEYPPGDTGQAVWMYYGLNGVAAHRCALMFGYEAWRVSVCPTLGYRELWGDWPKSAQWEDNTLSHNTVVVDAQRQSVTRSARPELFAQFRDFGGFSVDSPGVYPGVTRVYRRTMAVVKAGPDASYALDVFHVQGGHDHLISYHAFPGPVHTEGLHLTRQDGGSYAGADIPYGTSISGPGMGYSWLKEVERDPAPLESFLLDVRGTPPFPNLDGTEDLHVRYRAFTRFTDVALADGVPPGANPPAIRYFLGHRAIPPTERGKSDALASTFVSVIEPYRGLPVIREAARLEVSGGEAGLEAAAIRVELTDGGVDFLLAGPDDLTTCRVACGITFRGRLLALRTRGGSVEQAWLIRACRLSWGDFHVELPDVGFRGSIVGMDRGPVERGRVWVDTELPSDGSLIGGEIHIDNDQESNACYTIHDVEREGDRTRIDCGEVCFVRRFQDPLNYGKGYVHNFEVGAAWLIPHRLHIDRREPG